MARNEPISVQGLVGFRFRFRLAGIIASVSFFGGMHKSIRGRILEYYLNYFVLVASGIVRDLGGQRKDVR